MLVRGTIAFYSVLHFDMCILFWEMFILFETPAHQISLTLIAEVNIIIFRLLNEVAMKLKSESCNNVKILVELNTPQVSSIKSEFRI